MIARALEQKGIVSDRCEFNRQIKADNALLRELKAAVKALMQAVKNTVPAVAEAMEKLRGKMIILKYQLLHIGSGKHSIKQSLKVFRDEMAEYLAVTDKIKAKSKERKTLLTEKKETPVIHVLKHRDLTKRIAELTEDLEELRSEKALLLQKFEYAEDAGAEAFREDIATMEAGLKKLETQEQKYSAELDKALTEYAELKAQATEFDPVELYEARRAIREEIERTTIDRLKSFYGERYTPMMLLDSKRDMANLLNEAADLQAVKKTRQQRKESQKHLLKRKSPKHCELER